jgi:tetratricopeptide (TPR) repeat protein
MYAEADALRLRFTVQNDSMQPVQVSASGLRAAFSAQVAELGADEIPVAVRWPDEVYLYGDTVPTRLDWSQSVQLDPGTFAAWIALVGRADGRPFAAGGVYRIKFRFLGFATILRGVDERPLSVSAEDPASNVTIAVWPPTTAQERSQMYRLSAGEAYDRGDLETALRGYQDAARADATDTSARARMAVIYSRTRRYQEAVDIYERLLADGGNLQSLARLLAAAHLGLGDSVKASDVLRRAGYTEPGIARELGVLRKTHLEER